MPKSPVVENVDLETLKDLENRFKLAEREKNMASAGELFVSSMQIERNLGLENDTTAIAKLFKSQTLFSKSKIAHMQWRIKLFREIPEATFNKWLTTARNDESFRPNAIRDKAYKYVEEQTRLARVLKPLGVEGVEIYEGDITKVQSLRLGKAASIITDPPYPKEFLPLWRELVLFAGRVLQDHGWLLAMSGQRVLPQVFAQMESAAAEAGLQYVWTLECDTRVGDISQVWLDKSNAINTAWKPIMVYSKGTPQNWPSGFRDYVISPGNDKAHDEWGQNLDVFKTLVGHFSQPTDLVVDPFLGGGTTALAAHQLGRATEGFDINPADVITSIDRIANWQDVSNRDQVADAELALSEPE